MLVGGMQKLSLLDFPGVVSCIIFTQGCNFKCAYCQNSELIPYNSEDNISESELFDFLKSRRRMLDGIVISGGEPTVQKDLEDFIIRVRDLGYKVKLDTNGANPLMLERLINKKLLDYVAMDIKSSWDDYQAITISPVNVTNIKRSIDILKHSDIDREFRMTIIKNRHDINKIIEVCQYVGTDEKFYLQNFEDSENVVDKTLLSFTKSELTTIQNLIKDINPNVAIRGL